MKLSCNTLISGFIVILIFVFIVFNLDIIQIRNDITDTIEGIRKKIPVNHKETTSTHTNISSTNNTNYIRVCDQTQRRKHLKDMCEKFNYPGNKKQKTRFVVDYKNKVAYTYIQKAGCSTWKTIMVNISSHGKERSLKHVHLKLRKKYTSYGIQYEQLTVQEVKKKLKGFTKFIVVRNPLTRVVSSYRNKILNNNTMQSQFFKAYLRSINSAEAAKDYPSLESFIMLLLSDHRHSNNRHWNNFFERTNPCYIDYDYILKLETMQTDLKLLLSNAYKDVDYRIYQNLQRNPTSEAEEKDRNLDVTQHHFVLKMYDEVDPILVAKLADKFKYELVGFGYAYNIRSSTCECGRFRNRETDIACC